MLEKLCIPLNLNYYYIILKLILEFPSLDFEEIQIDYFLTDKVLYLSLA